MKFSKNFTKAMSIILMITLVISLTVFSSVNKKEVKASQIRLKAIKHTELIELKLEENIMLKSPINHKKLKNSKTYKRAKKAKKAKALKIKKKKLKNKLKKVGTYKITGYCPCSSCCGKSNGITASGTYAKAGRTIAADTSVLPMGTKVVIKGHTYTVEDRGGAIRGNRIDIYFSTHQAALNWGVRYVDVYTTK